MAGIVRKPTRAAKAPFDFKSLRTESEVERQRAARKETAVQRAERIGKLKAEAGEAVRKKIAYGRNAIRIKPAGSWARRVEDDFLEHAFKFTLNHGRLKREHGGINEKALEKIKDEIASHHMENFWKNRGRFARRHQK